MALDFDELLGRAAKAFPTQEAFAAALGISVGRLNRALNKRDYPLNVLNCLKLASITGEAASDILRAAGKSEIADLIEQLYGVRRGALTGEQRVLVELWERIGDSEARDVVVSAARRFAVLSDAGGPPPADADSAASTATSAKTRATKRGPARGRKR